MFYRILFKTKVLLHHEVPIMQQLYDEKYNPNYSICVLWGTLKDLRERMSNLMLLLEDLKLN